jgi:hypothetical protein
MKAGNPTVRRFFARICRDTIARCLKFEDQLQANLKPFSWTKDQIEKCAKIKELIEDKIRRNFTG